MSPQISPNDALVLLGERVFNSSPVKRTKTRRAITGLTLPMGHSANQADASCGSAAGVRKKLDLIAKGAPEVMVRVSGGGKTIRHIKAHLDYISRKGEIALEDQNREISLGRDEVDMVRDEWMLGGFPVSDAGRSRQAFNIILSMPAGTNERALKHAATEFAAAEFEGYQYVMAMHTFDTDPDPDPSPNPHVHLCVKAAGLDGTRLNPRKADLQRWRDRFAEKLRENGVEASSTRRLNRMQLQRGVKQSVYHKTMRGEPFSTIDKSSRDPPRLRAAMMAEVTMLRSYREAAEVLARSETAFDRELAAGLVRRIAVQRQVETVRPDPTPKR